MDPSQASVQAKAPEGFRWHLLFAALSSMGMAIIYGLKVVLRFRLWNILSFHCSQSLFLVSR